MFKQYLKDLKQAWKPATLTYIIAIVINLITGWSMDSIIVGMFCIVFVLILLWSVYVFINKN